MAGTGGFGPPPSRILVAGNVVEAIILRLDKNRFTVDNLLVEQGAPVINLPVSGGAE